MVRRILGFAIICYYLTSCKPLNPSIMFKTPKDYKYDVQQEDTLSEYKVAPNDILNFRLFANNGIRLLNIGNEYFQQFQQLNQGLSYLVEYDGHVNLPVIGRVKVSGMTLREAEAYLEELYGETFVDPFIILNVTNLRVTVFTGTGGNGRVITLTNNNVKLLEAIALAGGIAQEGRAAKVRLIRGDLSDPTVFLIDLSTIEGIRDADITLQANDIIYVEPIGVTTRQVLAEISPVLGFATSLITLYFVIESLNND